MAPTEKKGNDTKTVTAEYLEGIKDGREWFAKYGTEDMAEHIASLRRTIKGFAASSPVGQMLRGELDFWLNQSKQAA